MKKAVQNKLKWWEILWHTFSSECSETHSIFTYLYVPFRGCLLSMYMQPGLSPGLLAALGQWERARSRRAGTASSSSPHLLCSSIHVLWQNWRDLNSFVSSEKGSQYGNTEWQAMDLTKRLHSSEKFFPSRSFSSLASPLLTYSVLVIELLLNTFQPLSLKMNSEQ